jgi:RNA polymerase sigma factor (sigma-70 family)
MTQPPPLIDVLRRLAGPRPDDRSDADLLAQFVADRDPTAFDALVHRHGGLVWGICRRRTRDAHTAEDAFQTTFLALARHAASVRKADALGAWLHRVAVRCTAAVRTPREPMSALPPDVPTRAPGPTAAAEGRDLERVIDAEIDALPEPFRLAFVLCEVEEQTAADAARAMGCPVGTVESRLTRARERLRVRLARRGVTAGALIGLGLAADPAPAAARSAAVAMGTGTAPVPFARLALADRAVRAPLAGATSMGIGLAGSVVLVGLGGLMWAFTGGPELADSPMAFRPLPVPEQEIPEAEQFRRNRQGFPLPPEAIARVGDAWLRHGGCPDRLAFSNDGRFLATGAVGDRWLRVWDLTTGRPRAHLSLGPKDVPVSVALTPDGGTLRAVVRTGSTTHLREYDTFRALETRRRVIPTPVTAVFDSAGFTLATTLAGEVRMYNAATVAERWRAAMATTDPVETAFAGPDRLVVLTTESDRVRLYDISDGTPVDELVEPGAKLTRLAVSADGRTMALWLPMQNRVRIWDLANRRIVHTIVPKHPPVELAVAPDGSQVAVFAGWLESTLWNTRAVGKSQRIGYTASHIGKFSADGATLAVATTQQANYLSQFGVVQLIDAKTGEPNRSSPTEVEGPTPLTFHSEGNRVILQGTMGWLDCPTFGDDSPRAITPGVGPDAEAAIWVQGQAALSPDRKTLARSTAVNLKEQIYSLDLIDAVTHTPRNQIPLDGAAHRPAFSPDGRTVYAVVDQRVRGWDVASGRPVMTGNRPAGDLIYRLLVSSDGRYLATAVMVFTEPQRAGSIQVWDAATGESLISAEAGHASPYIAFSADGKRFAAAAVPELAARYKSEVRVWDLESRAVTNTFPWYDGQPAFSPDGRTLAVTRDGGIVLLEFASGQARHVFRHHGPVSPALAWRPDGRVLAAASTEAPVYLWDVAGDRTGTVPAWDSTQHERRWDALTGAAAEPAFEAIRELWAHPAEAASYLRSRVPAGADARLVTRACEALELPAAPEGKELLAKWAAGPANAPRTREAKDTLRRLAGTDGGGRG